MFNQTLRTRWGPWLWWVSLNTIGAALGVLIAFIVMKASYVIFRMNEDGIGGFALGGAIVVCVGIAQWSVIRRYLPQATWWIVVSVAGLFFGAILIGFTNLIVVAIVGSDTVSELMQKEILGMVVPLFLYGVSIGLGQWLFLRRFTAHAGWWVLSYGIGGALLGLVLGGSISSITDLIWFGTVPAITTGLVLVWLLQRPLTVIAGNEQNAA